MEVQEMRGLLIDGIKAAGAVAVTEIDGINVCGADIAVAKNGEDLEIFRLMLVKQNGGGDFDDEG